MYRQIIWPDHKRLADWAHTRGLKFIFHTDGNINGVMDLYIEAGFDCLQPLEAKAQMDIRELCPRYGDKIAMQGNINVMTIMTNDHDRIEEEVRVKLAAGMATRGYSYHSDHSVPPQCSLDTYRFLISLLDRYGNYT
jgi:uroporphyrinogen decarboxylase